MMGWCLFCASVGTTLRGKSVVPISVGTTFRGLALGLELLKFSYIYLSADVFLSPSFTNGMDVSG